MPAAEVAVIDWSPEYGDAFGVLNREWLERDFRVEPVDEKVLADPEGTIIGKGGAILYAILDGEAVGTVALKHDGGQVFELTKMAVTSAAQGRGIGRLLMDAAIARFKKIGGAKLYLESHSSLAPALRLYESAGFQHEPPPAPSEYFRADVYMVFRPGTAQPP